MSTPGAHHQTVLVADDNEANRDLLSALLSAEGYQVICAADGQQALKQMDGDSIDLALLDVVMPRPTGFEVCQAIKAKPETRLIPVVLLTSLNSDSDRIHGIMCGADEFLNKPAEVKAGGQHIRLFSEENALGVQASVYNVNAKNWIAPSESVMTSNREKTKRRNTLGYTFGRPRIWNCLR
jgi:CheY-like chemotaxis protein